MVCVHLKELFVLCEKHDLRLGGTDLIRIVCRQCGQEETCPSVLIDEYEARHPEPRSDASVEEFPEKSQHK